jgi:hypothetical protein
MNDTREIELVIHSVYTYMFFSFAYLPFTIRPLMFKLIIIIIIVIILT